MTQSAWLSQNVGGQAEYIMTPKNKGYLDSRLGSTTDYLDK